VLLLGPLRGEGEVVIDGVVVVVVPSVVLDSVVLVLIMALLVVLIMALLVVLMVVIMVLIMAFTDGIIVLMEVHKDMDVDAFGIHGELPHLLILKNLSDQ